MDTFRGYAERMRFLASFALVATRRAAVARQREAVEALRCRRIAPALPAMPNIVHSVMHAVHRDPHPTLSETPTEEIA